MDPFGDDAGAEEPTLDDFQAPEDPSMNGDFFEVENVNSNEIPEVPEENELTKFMKKYEEEIAEKAKEQEKVGEESREEAAAALAKFKEDREQAKEAKKASNRVEEQATLEHMAAKLEGDNPWERVTTLVNLDIKQRKRRKSNAEAKDKEEEVADTSRMRQLFLQLKSEPLEKTRGITA